MSQEKSQEREYSFVKKVWIVGLIFSFIATVLLIFEATFDLVILVLAGALIACYFRGISIFLQRKFNWRPHISLAVSVLASFLLFGGIFYLVGSTVVSDATEIQQSFPEMAEDVEQLLNKSPLGREIIVQAEAIKSSEEFSSFLSTFFDATLGGIINIYILILLGIFFTVAPGIYANGILQLVPPKRRTSAKELMVHLGSSLTKWLAGKFIAMFGVFALTAIGLILLDVPRWLTLSILAGLLNFIPNFGPLVSAVPAIMVGLSQSPTMALTVAILYFVVQFIESSLITPKAQQKLVKIPPALIILAQVFVGALSGVWGVIFATPLVLIILILVQELYVNPMNGKEEGFDKQL